jgi:hypothetical protein
MTRGVGDRLYVIMLDPRGDSATMLGAARLNQFQTIKQTRDQPVLDVHTEPKHEEAKADFRRMFSGYAHLG